MASQPAGSIREVPIERHGTWSLAPLEAFDVRYQYSQPALSII